MAELLAQNVGEKMKILQEGDAETRLKELTYLGNELYSVYSGDEENIAKICDTMIVGHLLDVFSSIWNEYHILKCYEDANDTPAKMLLALKVLLWNYSDKCRTLCEEVSRSKKIIPSLLNDLNQLDVTKLSDDYKRHHVKATFAILHNLLRHCNSNKKIITEAQGIQTFTRYDKSEYLIVKTYAALVLAYCSEQFVLDRQVCEYMLELLHSALESENHVGLHSLSAYELLDGIHKLAKTDSNKLPFVNAGLLLLLLSNLRSEKFSEGEIIEALKCLHQLVILSDNSTIKDKRNDIVEAVRSLSGQGQVQQLKEQILFRLKKENAIQNRKHVMISYQWDFQKQILQLERSLMKQGFTVWMDKKNMHGQLYDELSKAIDEAQVIIAAISSTYEKSENCKREFQYAKKIKRPILPVIVEPNYRPGGWLSMLLGNEIYVEIGKEVSMEKLNEIKKRLMQKGAEVHGN